jgi:hypothetical protein
MLTTCEGWAERLARYLDGVGTPAEREATERHLAACPACRAAAELSRCDVQDAAAALLARGAGADFAARVMTAVRTAEVAPADRYAEIDVAQPQKRAGWRFGLVELLVGIGLSAVFASIIFPVFAKARAKSFQSTCINNQRQLVISLMGYAQDHSEKLPPANDWVAATGLAADPKIFDCVTSEVRGTPANPDYGFNTKIGGIGIGTVPDPTVVPVTFDARNGQPEYRHLGGLLASYLDGHVSFTTKAELGVGLGSPSPSTPTIAPPTRNYGLAEKLLIAYRAELGLESADVAGAMERAERAFRGYDGFVLSSDYQRGAAGTPTAATVSGRVPSEKLGELLVALDGLGTLVSRTVNGEDLTAARMQQVETLGDLAGTQGRLGAIQDRAKPAEALKAEGSRSEAASAATGTRVDEYKLRSRVTLAEVTVRITATPPAPAPAANPLTQSFGRSAVALARFGRWLLAAVVIPLLVWLPVWGTLLGVTLYIRRRRKVK